MDIQGSPGKPLTYKMKINIRKKKWGLERKSEE